MATISIADNDARVQYTQAATANTTQLTIDFPFFGLDDINVIVTSSAGVDTTLTRGTGTGTFAVTGVSVDDGFSGGHVTVGDTYASGTKFTIFRDIAVVRTTDFPTSGPFNVSALNTELDKIFAIEQELETKVGRTMKLADSDTAASLTLPNLDTRKGTTLAFNETSGLPEVGPTIASVGTVSSNVANINTVAGISANVTTVAGINANVTTVAGISSSVTTVAGIQSDVTAVASDATDIGTVSTNIANVNTVAGDIANVNSVAGNATNINAVASNSTNINAVANNQTNINAVNTNASNINTVAGNNANVTTVAGISANVTTVAGISSNVTTVAGDSTDIGTLAAISSDISSLANALGASTTYTVTVAQSGGINVFYIDGVANPTLTLDRGNTYIFDQSDSSNTGHPLRFKDSSGNSYTTGVTVSSANPGSTGATVTIDVDNTAPSSLRYYCTVHGNGMGNTITVVNSNLALVASNITSVNSVASNATNINTAATNISNINTAATSISAINSFNDIFSAGSSAPNSPSEGDLWYDTSNSQLKVYVSGTFQIAGAYLQGLTTTHIFTATSNQTTFTTDDASNTMNIVANGNTLVFLNGIRLAEGSSSSNDYYINGNNVILNSGAAAGDVLYVEVFTKISLTQETSLNALVTQATTAKNNAATSETNAGNSATAAATSETNASNSATSAASSATTATSQASAASTSASNAATSETNAANSASAAASSASQAAASAGGGTLKITSNDTTADVLANKLVAGTGITASTLNAGGNEDLNLALSMTESNATATANQTTFNVTYTAGYIQVFMNGIKLIGGGSDFTASNGTTVVLASGAAAGDILEFVVFG